LSKVGCRVRGCCTADVSGACGLPGRVRRCRGHSVASACCRRGLPWSAASVDAPDGRWWPRGRCGWTRVGSCDRAATSADPAIMPPTRPFLGCGPLPLRWIVSDRTARFGWAGCPQEPLRWDRCPLCARACPLPTLTSALIGLPVTSAGMATNREISWPPTGSPNGHLQQSR
jgi:hypothetical protein